MYCSFLVMLFLNYPAYSILSLSRQMRKRGRFHFFVEYDPYKSEILCNDKDLCLTTRSTVRLLSVEYIFKKQFMIPNNT